MPHDAVTSLNIRKRSLPRETPFSFSRMAYLNRAQPGQAATPPSPVSRREAGMASPTAFIASITWSAGIRLCMPASAISAADSAFITPLTLR